MALSCNVCVVQCAAEQGTSRGGRSGRRATRARAPGGSSEGTSRASDQQSLGSAAERVRRELARLAVGGIS